MRYIIIFILIFILIHDALATNEQIKDIQSHICSVDEIITKDNENIHTEADKAEIRAIMDEIDGMKLQIENLKAEDEHIKSGYRELLDKLIGGK